MLMEAKPAGVIATALACIVLVSVSDTCCPDTSVSASESAAMPEGSGSSPSGRTPVAIAVRGIALQASSWLVLLNGRLVKHGYPYPMALAAMGQAFSGSMAYLCCRVGR